MGVILIGQWLWSIEGIF